MGPVIKSPFLTCGPKLAVLLLFFTAGAARSQSTYTFISCNLPDSGQTGSITLTFGEDSDYQPTASQPGFTMYYNAVDASSVTVDNRTGLMWVADPVGAGTSVTYTWEGAITACENLSYGGYTDWRLPDIRELMSVTDYGAAAAPVIRAKFFPNTQASVYWSATTYVSNTDSAWTVDFNEGVVDGYSKSTSFNYVRCVRGGS